MNCFELLDRLFSKRVLENFANLYVKCHTVVSDTPLVTLLRATHYYGPFSFKLHVEKLANKRDKVTHIVCSVYWIATSTSEKFHLHKKSV